MKRRLFNLAAVVSVLLCLAAVAAWVDGYWHIGIASFAVRKLSACVIFNDGSVNLSARRELNPRLFGGRAPAPMFLAIHDFNTILYDDHEESIDFRSRIHVLLMQMPPDWHGFGASSEDGFALSFGGGVLEPPNLGPDYHIWHVCVPAWFLVVMTGVFPSAWLVRWRQRRRRVLENHCEKCGYDLRATPDRCPECGSVRGVAE